MNSVCLLVVVVGVVCENCIVDASICAHDAALCCVVCAVIFSFVFILLCVVRAHGGCLGMLSR